eukprot:Hpha_TRINITY_DN3060_c0_g1::TRINITY_DN3060_c0_g1_i1::g.138739::m.138739
METWSPWGGVIILLLLLLSPPHRTRSSGMLLHSRREDCAQQHNHESSSPKERTAFPPVLRREATFATYRPVHYPSSQLTSSLIVPMVQCIWDASAKGRRIREGRKSKENMFSTCQTPKRLGDTALRKASTADSATTGSRSAAAVDPVMVSNTAAAASTALDME